MRSVFRLLTYYSANTEESAGESNRCFLNAQLWQKVGRKISEISAWDCSMASQQITNEWVNLFFFNIFRSIVWWTKFATIGKRTGFEYNVRFAYRCSDEHYAEHKLFHMAVKASVILVSTRRLARLLNLSNRRKFEMNCIWCLIRPRDWEFH